jgi:hypothetical protein
MQIHGSEKCRWKRRRKSQWAASLIDGLRRGKPKDEGFMVADSEGKKSKAK